MIKFVYFDVGGVVINDFTGNHGWAQLKAELGVTPDIDEAFMKTWYLYEHELLVGRDINTLVPLLRSEFNLPIIDTYSLLDGFVKRFSQNKAIWPIIDEVKRKAGIGLLTNMYPGMLSAIQANALMPDVNWDSVIDSSIELLKKPDKALFILAEQRADASGNEILFIDNTLGHVEQAASIGWLAYYYDSSQHIESCVRLKRFLAAHGL